MSNSVPIPLCQDLMNGGCTRYGWCAKHALFVYDGILRWGMDFTGAGIGAFLAQVMGFGLHLARAMCPGGAWEVCCVARWWNLECTWAGNGGFVAQVCKRLPTTLPESLYMS